MFNWTVSWWIWWGLSCLDVFCLHLWSLSVLLWLQFNICFLNGYLYLVIEFELILRERPLQLPPKPPQKRIWRGSTVAPFAGNNMLVLYSCPANNSSKYFVQVLHNEHPIPIPVSLLLSSIQHITKLHDHLQDCCHVWWNVVHLCSHASHSVIKMFEMLNFFGSWCSTSVFVLYKVQNSQIRVFIFCSFHVNTKYLFTLCASCF